MRWLDHHLIMVNHGNITTSMDMSLSKLQKIVEDRGAWYAAAYGDAES